MLFHLKEEINGSAGIILYICEKLITKPDGVSQWGSEDRTPLHKCGILDHELASYLAATASTNLVSHPFFFSFSFVASHLHPLDFHSRSLRQVPQFLETPFYGYGALPPSFCSTHFLHLNPTQVDAPTLK